ncbi:MAG: response regulator [Candidatus Nanohaloarchaea archaeon]
MIEILLVDDDEAYLDLAESFLGEEDNISLDTTADPGGIVDSAGDYDGLVLDQRMGRVKGADIASQVLEMYEDVDVVVYSGLGREDIDLPDDAGFLKKSGGMGLYDSISEYFTGG